MEYIIKKVNEPVPMDGDPTQGIWEQTEQVSMKDAITGNEPKLATLFRLLYDDTNLYIGYSVEDDSIFASYTDHDYPLYQEDVVEIFISPSGSTHYYYEFNFSPKQVVFDAIILNDGGQEGKGRGNLFIPLVRWDCEGLKIKVAVQDTNDWSATVSIPFSRLHLAGNRTPEPGDVWKGNLFRIEYGGDEIEYSAWNPPGICDFHTSEKFGNIVFS